MIDKFNVRIYGVLKKGNKILVSHENIDGYEMTKLPGGGLEFGEGPHDCLIREFDEELKISISIVNLLHTTTNYIQSTFRADEQIIAIHYLVHSDEHISSYNTTQGTKVGKQNIHHFEWKELNSELLNILTFDMDRQAILQLL